MRFSRQEYWSGLPFPSPGDLPSLGIEPRYPALQADSLLTEKPTFILLDKKLLPIKIGIRMIQSSIRMIKSSTSITVTMASFQVSEINENKLQIQLKKKLHILVSRVNDRCSDVLTFLLHISVF